MKRITDREKKAEKPVLKCGQKIRNYGFILNEKIIYFSVNWSFFISILILNF